MLKVPPKDGDPVVVMWKTRSGAGALTTTHGLCSHLKIASWTRTAWLLLLMPTSQYNHNVFATLIASTVNKPAKDNHPFLLSSSSQMIASKNFSRD
jgi:hypothetical protein